MDDQVNRFAQELAEAISVAVSEHPGVEQCREQARKAGYEMVVSLEAVIGFKQRISEIPDYWKNPNTLQRGQKAATSEPGKFEITPNDRRFLRSLRIGDNTAQEKEGQVG